MNFTLKSIFKQISSSLFSNIFSFYIYDSLAVVNKLLYFMLEVFFRQLSSPVQCSLLHFFVVIKLPATEVLLHPHKKESGAQIQLVTVVGALEYSCDVPQFKKLFHLPCSIRSHIILLPKNLIQMNRI